jgi:hypothetical protein
MCRQRRHACWRRGLATTALLLGSVAVAAAQQVLPTAPVDAPTDIYGELSAALIRLPLAAVLGTILALRPRRPGTPRRSMPVVETQIVLAIVGALIMLVVGASLARAFGIVGAANLIRYRAKIDDPKDAVVMLAALSVGLASGVGLYVLATFGTLFVGATLWVIEGFEPAQHKSFELKVDVKSKAGDLKQKIEQILRRAGTTWELRASSEDSVTYFVEAPPELELDRVSDALGKLVDDESLAVEWDEKKPKRVG